MKQALVLSSSCSHRFILNRQLYFFRKSYFCIDVVLRDSLIPCINLDSCITYTLEAISLIRSSLSRPYLLHQLHSFLHRPDLTESTPSSCISANHLTITAASFASVSVLASSQSRNISVSCILSLLSASWESEATGESETRYTCIVYLSFSLPFSPLYFLSFSFLFSLCFPHSWYFFSLFLPLLTSRIIFAPPRKKEKEGSDKNKI